MTPQSSLPPPDDGSEIGAAFRLQTGIDLPGELLFAPMHRVRGAPMLRVYAPGAELYLGAGDLERFRSSAPPDYRMLGFWGHGANSHAFYSVASAPAETIYLRLHTGGAYTDPAACMADIADYLPALQSLLRTVRRRNGSAVIVEAMGHAHYEITIDGETRVDRQSLLGAPDALERMRALTDQGKPARYPEQDAADVARLRGAVLALIGQRYDIEMRRASNPLVGMRAMGAAKRLVGALEPRPPLAAFRHDLRWKLAALAERHRDPDGEDRYARACFEELQRAVGAL